MRHTWPSVVGSIFFLTIFTIGHGHPQERMPFPPERRGADPETVHHYERLQTIAAQYQAELAQIPGVYTVMGGGDRIIVGVYIHTDARGTKPATLPPALQTLPQMLEGYPVEVSPVYILPPPPGVVVSEPLPPLPGTELCPERTVRGWNTDHFECFAVQEECPPLYREELQFDWRFCLAPISATLPALMSLPIAGIPFEKVEEIWARRQEEIVHLPGIHSAGIGAEGIVVETENPTVIPSDLEGVPVIVKFPQGRIFIGADLQGYHSPHLDERGGQ